MHFNRIEKIEDDSSPERDNISVQRRRRNEERRYEDRQQVNYAAIPSVNIQRNMPTDQQVFQIVNTANTFTIKDVEGSIPFFTGDDKVPIKRWITEFENTNTLLRWNDLRMVIYGKKMLRGSAKQFIALESGLTSWAEFKKRMIKEFQIEVNSATIHAQLLKRKRLANETPRQYVCAIHNTANQGFVEDEALIQYIIDGIPDDESNKQILYNARNLTELKKSLEIYDRMQEKSRKKKPTAKSETNKDKKQEKKDPKQTTTKKFHCFACESAEHEVK